MLGSEIGADPPPAPDGHLDKEVVDLLFAVIGLMKQHFVACTAALDLSPQQAHALRCLDPARPLPMRDLAAELMCDASTVTGLVDRLEQRHLVERRADPDDRRVKALVLTAAGIDARHHLIALLMARAPHLVALEAAERDQLRHLLRRILEVNAPGWVPPADPHRSCQGAPLPAAAMPERATPDRATP